LAPRKIKMDTLYLCSNEGQNKKALLEKLPLQGICRIFDVDLIWLMEFIKNYSRAPNDLRATIDLAPKAQLQCTGI
jgi:hypothetical protein